MPPSKRWQPGHPSVYRGTLDIEKVSGTLVLHARFFGNWWSIYQGHDTAEDRPSVWLFMHPKKEGGRKILMNLSAMTEDELLTMAEAFGEAVSRALPITRERDKNALEADSNDVARLIRQPPHIGRGPAFHLRPDQVPGKVVQGRDEPADDAGV